MAEPADKTTNTPNISNTIISGNSQNFFLAFKNAHNSLKDSLQLNTFKKDKSSAMVIRDYTFSSKDIEHPY